MCQLNRIIRVIEIPSVFNVIFFHTQPTQRKNAYDFDIISYNYFLISYVIINVRTTLLEIVSGIKKVTIPSGIKVI